MAGRGYTTAADLCPTYKKEDDWLLEDTVPHAEARCQAQAPEQHDDHDPVEHTRHCTPSAMQLMP